MTRITKGMLTEWFPEHIKPIHPGVNQVRRTGLNRGYAWIKMLDAFTSPYADPFGAGQKRSWRGLKEKPE